MPPLCRTNGFGLQKTIIMDARRKRIDVLLCQRRDAVVEQSTAQRAQRPAVRPTCSYICPDHGISLKPSSTSNSLRLRKRRPPFQAACTVEELALSTPACSNPSARYAAGSARRSLFKRSLQVKSSRDLATRPRAASGDSVFIDWATSPPRPTRLPRILPLAYKTAPHRPTRLTFITGSPIV